MGESENPITACANCGEEISSQWVVCPRCAQPANKESGALLCLKCKKQIAPDAQICPHCHVPIIRRYCSGCHRLIPDHAGFCPYCQSSSTSKPGLRKTTIIAALFVLGSIVVGMSFFYRNNQKPIPTPQRAQVTISQKNSKTKPIKEVMIKPEPSPIVTPGKAKKVAEGVQTIPPGPQRVEQVTPDPDLASRGARILQGRKLSRVGLQYLRQGKYQKAALVFSDAVRIFPAKTEDATYGEALFYLGYSLRMAGKPEQAIPILKRALNFPYYRTRAARELETVKSQVNATR